MYLCIYDCMSQFVILELCLQFNCVDKFNVPATRVLSVTDMCSDIVQAFLSMLYYFKCWDNVLSTKAIDFYGILVAWDRLSVPG